MPACIVKAVTAIEDHPNPEASNTNVIRTADAQLVSAKVDGNPRYSVGDLVVHIPGGSLLPPALQERMGARDSKIRSSNYKGYRSEGMLLPVAEVPGTHVEGADVTDALGVTYAP